MNVVGRKKRNTFNIAAKDSVEKVARREGDRFLEVQIQVVKVFCGIRVRDSRTRKVVIPLVKISRYLLPQILLTKKPRANFRICLQITQENGT